MKSQEAKKLEEKILKILKKYFENPKLIKDLKNIKVLIGVSGGPDSIFLLEMLKKYNEKSKKSKISKILIAHLNHQLRGLESQKDEEFVEKFYQDSSSNILEYQVKKIDVSKISKTNKENLEACGRRLRYQFFQDLADSEEIKIILTAHHGDDNLETFLFNLVRGSAISGLKGMEEIQNFLEIKESENPKDSTKIKKTLLRPLLTTTKKEIEDYLNFKKIPFCRDKSNLNTKFHRNKIRHQVIPKLKEINPNLNKTFARNFKIFKEIEDFLEIESNKWIKENLKNLEKPKTTQPLKTTNSKAKSPTFYFEQKTFVQNHPALQLEIIKNIYKKTTGEFQNIQAKNFDEIIKIINKNVGKKEKKFGKITIKIEKGKVEIIS